MRNSFGLRRLLVTRGRSSFAPPHGFGDVFGGVFGQVLLHRREALLLFSDPSPEHRRPDYVSRVEHVAMPDATQLGTTYVEALELRGLDEHDVVGIRVRVCLDPQLIGPERV